ASASRGAPAWNTSSTTLRPVSTAPAAAGRSSRGRNGSAAERVMHDSPVPVVRVARFLHGRRGLRILRALYLLDQPLSHAESTVDGQRAARLEQAITHTVEVWRRCFASCERRDDGKCALRGLRA